MLPIASSPRASMKYVRKIASPSRMNAFVAVPFADAEIRVEVVRDRVPGHPPSPSAPSRARCSPGARARRMRAWCRGRSDERRGRPGPPPSSSRCRHGRAIRGPPRLEERAIDDQLTATVEQVEQARPADPGPRTRTRSPPAATASADARRPARHGRGSALSPARAVSGAQRPTPLTRRLEACSWRSPSSASGRACPNQTKANARDVWDGTHGHAHGGGPYARAPPSCERPDRLPARTSQEPQIGLRRSSRLHRRP